jgi:large subunit ribosomal protein L14
MIQVQTWLNTIDNSGARFVECIHTIGGFNRKYAYPGDFILISVKQLRLVRKVKIGQIHLALITRTRKNAYFKDGTYSNSQKNIVLIINRKKRILCTSIFGWFSRKLRRKKFLRILIICGRHII